MFKLIIGCSIFFLSSNTFAYNKLLPGKTYSLHDVQIYRSLIKNAKNGNEKQLSGSGFEFQGYLQIEENKETKIKKYFTTIRDCGKVELQPLDDATMKKARSGAAITLKFKESRTCIVSDWKFN